MTNITVRITRPELTPQERDKRMEEIKKAAAALVAAQRREQANAG